MNWGCFHIQRTTICLIPNYQHMDGLQRWGLLCPFEHLIWVLNPIPMYVSVCVCDGGGRFLYPSKQQTILHTPAGCPIVQLNVDPIHPEIASDSIRCKGSVPQNCPMPQLQVITCASEQPVIECRFQQSSPLGSVNFKKWLTEFEGNSY